MGIIQCHKHGDGGFYEVCEHVYNAFRDNIVPEDMRKLKFGETIFLCASCYEKENMQRFEGIDLYTEISKLIESGQEDDAALEALSEAYYEAYRNINRRVFCADCYSDVQFVYARNNNLPDPFIAYEHTITHEDAAEITALKNYLHEQYDFAGSIVDLYEDKKALFISSGSVERPLTILVYYITDVAKQEKLLSLINNFFEGKERFQRKVFFREKENWMPHKHGFTRGPEPNIREEITR